MSPTREIKKILAELTEALEADSSVASGARVELENAADQIRERLAVMDPDGGEGAEGGASSAKDDGESSVRDRLSRAVEDFEGKHPKLTEVVGRVVDALAEMGV